MLNFCDFIQVYVFTTNHHLKQNRACKQEFGHCHQILLYLFHFVNSENQGATNALYKISAKYIKWFRR